MDLVNKQIHLHVNLMAETLVSSHLLKSSLFLDVIEKNKKSRRECFLKREKSVKERGSAWN